MKVKGRTIKRWYAMYKKSDWAQDATFKDYINFRYKMMYKRIREKKENKREFKTTVSMV